MHRLIALVAALGLAASACAGIELPVPPMSEPSPPPAGATPQPADPAPALSTAQLEALARTFAPPGMTDETTVEAGGAYQLHGRSEMSLDELEVHWRQMAGAQGMRIESVSKSADTLLIMLTGAGAEWAHVGGIARGHGIDVSVIVALE
jgi:hypothetical protein